MRKILLVLGALASTAAFAGPEKIKFRPIT
jgi:hypothetical protein